MYSLALAFLSTGSVVIYMVIFYLYRKKIFRNEMMLITFNVFLLVVVFALSGAFIHKALFFLDQDIYGSATNTSIGNLTAIGFNDILTIIKNIVSRGVLIEAISDKPVRLVVILLFSCFVLFNVFFKAKKLDLLLFVLFVFGFLMEGLTLYCLFSSIIMLSFYKLPRIYKNRFFITLIA